MLNVTSDCFIRNQGNIIEIDFGDLGIYLTKYYKNNYYGYSQEHINMLKTEQFLSIRELPTLKSKIERLINIFPTAEYISFDVIDFLNTRRENPRIALKSICNFQEC